MLFYAVFRVLALTNGAVLGTDLQKRVTKGYSLSSQKTNDNIERVEHVSTRKRNKADRPIIFQRLYSVEDAAKYLGRSVYAVREIYYAGKLPVVRIDGRVFIDVQDMDLLIKNSKVTYDYC